VRKIKGGFKMTNEVLENKDRRIARKIKNF